MSPGLAPIGGVEAREGDQAAERGTAGNLTIRNERTYLHDSFAG